MVIYYIKLSTTMVLPKFVKSMKYLVITYQAMMATVQAERGKKGFRRKNFIFV